MKDKIIEQVREAKTVVLDKDGKEIMDKPKKPKTQKTEPEKKEEPKESSGTNEKEMSHANTTQSSGMRN